MYGLGPVLQADGSGAVFLLIILLFILGIFAAVGYATYWVYNDAKKRPENEAGLWVALMLGTFFFVGIFGPPLVLLAWVLIRGDEENEQETTTAAAGQTTDTVTTPDGTTQQADDSDDEKDPWAWDEEDDDSDNR